MYSFFTSNFHLMKLKIQLANICTNFAKMIAPETGMFYTIVNFTPSTFYVKTVINFKKKCPFMQIV